MTNPPDDKTDIFSYDIQYDVQAYLYNLLFSNRQQIKNVTASNMSSKSLNITKIICKLKNFFVLKTGYRNERNRQFFRTFEMLDKELNSN